jgi:uncharacterized protein (DUF305 family)
MKPPRVALIAVLGVPVVFGLVGCGGDKTTPSAVTATTSAVPTSTAVTSMTTTSVSAPSPGPSDGHITTDVEFSQLMIAHDAQAIWMSQTVLAAKGIDPRVRALAEMIRAGQKTEIDQYVAWLTAWESKVPPTTAVAVNPAETTRLNMGMVTEKQMTALKSVEGTKAARLYLELMIKNHQGAVAIADSEAFGGSYPPTTQLARKISADLQSQLATMQQILADL